MQSNSIKYIVDYSVMFIMHLSLRIVLLTGRRVIDSTYYYYIYYTLLQWHRIKTNVTNHKMVNSYFMYDLYIGLYILFIIYTQLYLYTIPKFSALLYYISIRTTIKTRFFFVGQHIFKEVLPLRVTSRRVNGTFRTYRTYNFWG